MTFLTQTRSAAFGTGFLDSIRAQFAALASWRDASKTRHALYQLSDTQLEDIGLCRGDIAHIKG